MAAHSSRSLKEYLKRYQSSTDEPKKTKKKKKEKPKPQSTGGVLVVDEDPVWQKPVQIEDEEEDNSVGDETPQIEEDIEVKRMKRLEALRTLKPYHGISEDGSGWVPIPKPFRSSTAKGSDLSPQQHQHDSVNSDVSPAANQQPRRLESPSDLDENMDLSPPRKRPGQLDTASPHPQSDGHQREASDLSPPRRRHIVDLSPPRRSKFHRQEVEGRPGQSVDDLSPPRKSRRRPADDLSSPGPLPPSSKEPPLTKEARKGGLLSATEMKEELDRKKRDEKARFASMDPSMTGKGAEVVYRDKEGKKISKEELNKPKEEKKEPKPLEWGKGLAQKRDAEERGKELELEKERPFARSRDDPELDMMLKEKIRWGDPMAHLVKRKSSELTLEDLGDNEKMKESGFVIPQTTPNHSWLKRGLDFLPNRYGIRPGRHWDGVDRSNGYEKELYKRQNEKRATETEAYLWSVSDM